jgi:hypothetical protein
MANAQDIRLQGGEVITASTFKAADGVLHEIRAESGLVFLGGTDVVASGKTVQVRLEGGEAVQMVVA